MYIRFALICSLFCVLNHPVLARQQTNTDPLAQIRESHIAANVPPAAVFEHYLRRDLTAYFHKSLHKDVTVDYKFLRDGPTQSGVSYPKYYLWVTVKSGKNTLETGGVQVAAIDQKRFDVTDYLSKTVMKKNPVQIDGIFPRPVGNKIRQKLKVDRDAR